MIEQFVNLDKYPLDHPDSAAYQQAIAASRKSLAKNSIVTLDDFLSPDGLACFQQEVAERTPDAFHSTSSANSYFGTTKSEGFANSHPLNFMMTSERHGLGHHQMLGTKMSELYNWAPMRSFVKDICQVDAVYCSDDPSNSLVAQVYKEGCNLTWHFDRALFSAVINLTSPKGGGVFECVPDLRSDDDEHYDEVEDVLHDRSDRVQRYSVKEGSYTIMFGRYTLHRVTNVEQEDPRTSLILGYELEPGVRMDNALRKQLFGPSAPISQ